jgi:hypothetical protein
MCPALTVLAVFTAGPTLPPIGVRPVSEADNVLAVLYTNNGLLSNGVPKAILIVWPDGYAVWSKDRIEGGPPYTAGRVDLKKYAALVAEFDRDGLFNDKKLGELNYGPDAEYNSVLVKAGKKRVEMHSWHEVAEAGRNLVARESGQEPLRGRRRLAVLKTEPADYLYYRMVWAETRLKLAALLPETGTPTRGGLEKKAGETTWRERVDELTK